MNTKESISADTYTPQSEQPTSVQQVGQNGPTATFFAVGIIINIVMIAAYFIWAYKQWKQSDSA
jgi:hypothetical protein